MDRFSNTNMTHCCKVVEQREYFTIAAGNENLYSTYGTQRGSSLDNWESISRQLYHCGSLNVVGPHSFLWSGSCRRFDFFGLGKSKSCYYHECYERLHIETGQGVFRLMTIIEVRLNTFSSRDDYEHLGI